VRTHWLSATLLISTSFCFGQSVAIGVKSGLPATTDISGDAVSESKRYTIGPILDVGLLLGFGAEVDALYQREGFRTSFSNFAGGSDSRERANSWQFPILLKYRLPFPVVKPYVAVGYAWRVIRGTEDTNGYSIDLETGQITSGRTHLNTNWNTGGGVVVGGGVQFGVGSLRLSPELRYTRWTNAAINVFGPGGYAYQSASNQVDVLVGLGWKIH